MSYNKALKKLESLPVGERQLAAGQYVWEVKKGKSHCGCAIGKLLTERQRVKLFKVAENEGGTVSILRFLGHKYLYSILSDDPFGLADLTYYEAGRLQAENDGFNFVGKYTDFHEVDRNSYANRKARYKHVIAWLKEQVAIAEPAPDATAVAL